MEQHNTIIIQTIAYIEENLNKELRLDDISDKMHYSKFHLNRLFAEKVGTTIYKYIQMRRLTNAAKSLVETDAPITDIAYEANYNSQQSFMLAFEKVYQYTPQHYRNLGIFHPIRNRFVLHNKYAILRKVPLKYALSVKSPHQYLIKKCEVMAA